MSRPGPRVAVVGAGNIGRTHLNSYRQAGCAPIAIVDVNFEAARSVAQEGDLTPYRDINELLAEVDLDAISICTPPALHAEIAVPALRAGVAVLCEKPMAPTITDCRTMITAAESTGALLTIGFCHRFQPEIETIRNLVAQGRIGTLLSFRNRFSGPLDGVESLWFSRPEISGGGVLMDTCVHSVDLFRYLVGEVEQVQAVMASTATQRGPAVPVEDTAVLALQSVSGVLGVIEASWRTAPGEAVLTLSGSAGRLELDYATLQLTLYAEDGSASPIEVARGDRFVRQARHFLACVREAEKPRVTADDGLRAVEVLSRAYASAGRSPSTISKQRSEESA
ncbi:MAG TPA: Gfo/Idh/MocA family oxidoreductase [Microlunatus sp.]